jgi:hypothetical protein
MRRTGALLLVTVLLGFGLAACSDDDEPAETTDDSPAEEATGPPLEVTLELASDEVATAAIVDGSVEVPSVDGTVHVRNTTDEPIRFALDGDEAAGEVDACGAQVAAGIALPSAVADARNTAVFPAVCQVAEAIEPGDELTFDVTLSATGVGPTGDTYGFDPGEYAAWVVISPALSFAPLPEPTPITVTS